MFPPGLLANGSEKLDAGKMTVPPKGGDPELTKKSWALLKSSPEHRRRVWKVFLVRWGPTPPPHGGGKQVPLAIHTRKARETGIARECQSGRRILVNPSLFARDHIRKVEVVHGAIGHRQREEGFVTQAGVERQTRAQLPGIAHIRAEVPLFLAGATWSLSRCCCWARLRAGTPPGSETYTDSGLKSLNAPIIPCIPLLLRVF